MGLITRDLAEKGLAPDPGSIVIRAAVAGTGVQPSDIEIDVNVSWVGIPAQDDGEPSSSPARPRRSAAADADVQVPPADLLDEAPSLSGRPHVAFGSMADSPGPGEVGVNDVTAASRGILQAGGEGPFSRARVTRRLSDNESAEWPGNPPPRGR